MTSNDVPGWFYIVPVGYLFMLGLCVAGAFYPLLRREFTCFAAAAALRAASCAPFFYPLLQKPADPETQFRLLQLGALAELFSLMLSVIGFILLTIRIYMLSPARR